MTTPKQLKQSFQKLFEQQRSIETDLDFISKRQQYKDMDLQSKYDLATLSEIFQDPELLIRISSDTSSLLNIKEKEARPRNSKKKLEAKDVPAHRVIPDEESEKFISLELPQYTAQQEEDGSARKRGRDEEVETGLKRKCHGTEEISDQDSVVEVGEQLSHELSRKGKEREDTVSSSQSESSQSQTTLPVSVHNLNLALPAPCASDITDKSNEPEEEEYPLAKALKETAALYKESKLKTIGSKYLYNLLPRQCEPNAYKYVKEDYNPPNLDIEDERLSLDDTLLTVTVYDPTTTAKKFQEIEILGSQRISDLRDAVYCLTDFVMNNDKLAKQPGGKVINTLGKKLSPSMIYMDHIFYIDTRSEAFNSDYYDSWIDSWLTKKGVNKSVFSYTKKSMDGLFQDVALDLTKPSALIHQDKCEHMLMVQSVRLIANNEFGSKDEFPRATYNLRYIRFKCSMCTILPATKMTEEEIISGFSPCYYCDNCFDSFHSENTTTIAKEYCGSRGGARGPIRKKQSINTN